MNHDDDIDDADPLAVLRRRVAAQSWDAHHDQWQNIDNALPIPPRHRQHDGRIDVVARIVWARDGAEQIDTRATAWTHNAVLVEILDPRWHLRGVWIAPGDVRRR